MSNEERRTNTKSTVGGLHQKPESLPARPERSWKAVSGQQVVARSGHTGGKRVLPFFGRGGRQPRTKRAMKFGRLAATLDCMSMDRSDVQYAAKDMCTNAAKPTQGSRTRLTNTWRYLTCATMVTWKMRAGDDDELNIDVCVW